MSIEILIVSILSYGKTYQQLNLAKNSLVVRDPTNELNNPKALPGTLQRYEMHLHNKVYSTVPMEPMCQPLLWIFS